MKKSIWLTLDSMDGERKLKQHCFVPNISKGGNERNKSLCGNISVGNDDCKPALFEEIYNEHGGSELVNRRCVCIKCYEIYFKKFNNN
jgi:hypothetical protein